MKYYVLGMYSDVEPTLSDPFDAPEERDKKAIQWKQDDEMDDGGIYRLNIDDNGIPTVESFGYQELNPSEEDDLLDPIKRDLYFDDLDEERQFNHELGNDG